MKKLSRERIRPIRDEVYERLRKAIIQGAYKPGDKLQEEQLAEQLGISRTPVREALRKLEMEKLVLHSPHRGTIVSDVSVDEVEDLYHLRELAETIITKRAAMNATPADISRLRSILAKGETYTDPDDILDGVEAFNNALFELACADSLVDIERRIRLTLQRVTTSNHLDPERRKSANAEHHRIVDAMAARDMERIEACIREHLSHSPRALRK